MFTSRISVPTATTPEPEDIFSSALSSLFTDDAQNNHGTPGSSVTYHSPRFGDIRLRIPNYPDVEEGRKLFAHHLWNAGVIVADAIEDASRPDHNEYERGNTGSESGNLSRNSQWARKYWDVRGRRVLELGAGTALPSIISALSGAASVSITDHPSSPALTTGAIEQNVRHNVLDRGKTHAVSDRNGTGDQKAKQIVNGNPPGQSTTSDSESGSESSNTATPATSHCSDSNVDSKPEINIWGYTWGTAKMYLPNHYGKPAPHQPDTFNKIIIADCLWMPTQHVNLVKTILRYLEPSHSPSPPASHSTPTSPANPSTHSAPNDGENCALVVAGFHTGRGIVRHFFEVATGEGITKTEDEDDDPDPELVNVQGRLRAAEIFEIDVNGVKRPWLPVREGEAKDVAKRWCVCAVLVRR